MMRSAGTSVILFLAALVMVAAPPEGGRVAASAIPSETATDEPSAGEKEARAALDSVMAEINGSRGRVSMDVMMDQAEKGLRGIIKRYPQTAAAGSARSALGRIYYMTGRPGDARKVLKAFLEGPGEKSPAEMHMAWMMLGAIELDEENFEESRLWFGKITSAEGVDGRVLQMARDNVGRLDTLKKLAIGAPHIEFSATDIAGNEVSSAEYRGKVVLLDFWATWCAPCRAEMPHVKRIYSKFHEKGFDIIGISLDNDRSALDRYLEEQEIAWRQIYDGKGWQAEIGRIYAVTSIPATYLIDRQGKIRYKNVRGDDFERAVRKLLEEK